MTVTLDTLANAALVLPGSDVEALADRSAVKGTVRGDHRDSIRDPSRPAPTEHSTL